MTCRFCNGDGEKFILPRGNPFNMRLPQLAQAMVKVRCSHCSGEQDSWWCDQCCVEVYGLRCLHCSKTEKEKR